VGKSPYSKSLSRLTRGGRYILANVGFTPMLRGVWTTLISDKTVVSAMAAESKAPLEEIKNLIEAGKLRPVVDRVFTMQEIPAAHGYIDSGKRQGNTVASFID
jgi:NADPH:quinone reductase-like Zn-dependent oxidoreductase